MTTEDIKEALLSQMRNKGISKGELARRLGVTPREATRVCDLRHQSTLPTLIAALNAVGLTLAVRRLP